MQDWVRCDCAGRVIEFVDTIRRSRLPSAH
jgi:hypothetical protein